MRIVIGKTNGWGLALFTLCFLVSTIYPIQNSDFLLLSFLFFWNSSSISLGLNRPLFDREANDVVALLSLIGDLLELRVSLPPIWDKGSALVCLFSAIRGL